MCTGVEIALLAGVAVSAAAAGTTAIVAATQKPPSMSDMPEAPTPPDPEAIKKQAKDDAKKRAALKTKTVLTSGAGVIADAGGLKKKTLLGG